MKLSKRGYKGDLAKLDVAMKMWKRFIEVEVAAGEIEQQGRILDNKDNSLVFGVFKLMKWVSKDPSYNWWQFEYPRELFLGSRSFGFAVLGQMTYLVASSTLDSARSYVMQGASFTQGTVSSIPIGGNISPGGFSPFILLVVILVMVVIVVVVLVVVVIGVVIVVAIIGNYVLLPDPLTFDLFWGLEAVTFPSMLLGWAYVFHQDKASSVRVPVPNVTLFSSAHLLRENTDSVRSNQRIRLTAPSVPLK
ncbi:hypothetical protein Tco_0939373 [Tanacetum coccineum]|uniref:Uncharacterized protein n=1 Tax=Tanacetum coccineum TaxID=301880 RepID=A0ABQ5DMH1_9ASTR